MIAALASGPLTGFASGAVLLALVVAALFAERRMARRRERPRPYDWSRDGA